ncbi:MAG: undecaprenyldiphospho-muramoylpentapeptide beta-N-acetylglucosaminyltransferase [Gammaproteobacteria bacterium]|jgi:UDP-N-acetylglucosamine--N-acetylmuramyl-(pentapeptide) pyrophosphoryl-undecaprenol N-acetylglucosamine transferase|nr:undecaprenyldiphospho-muramoylpentapeptide beta-N-acetylglucosaminyltransferase [Gammaproteobacteria bacterium]
MKPRHIFFTGGGSAGHVTPNIALIKQAQKMGDQVSYVGSEQGIERQLIEPLNIPYYAVDSGKLARQLTLKNLLSPFKILHGIWQSYFLCRKLKPDVVFSKGGFVAVPIVIGAWLNHIPVIVHESDMTPGLANKLCYPFAEKVGVSFLNSQQFFKNKDKVVWTGTPIRQEMLEGNAAHGKTFLNFSDEKPILLIYGGGLGSVVINQAVRGVLPELLKQFNIVHCCGKGKIDAAFSDVVGYRQFEYLNQELPDVMAAADVVISRAGANSVFELLALHKPHLLIPLSKKASRGDQIDNAKYCQRLGLSDVLLEEELTPASLLEHVQTLWNSRQVRKEKLMQYALPNAVEKLMSLIQAAV